MTNSESITCLPQEWETPAQVVRRGGFSYRYSYARSADSQASGEPGQDYLTIREDEQRLAFALCDGVSQSFFGDLAARWVGEALLSWLWEELPPSGDHEKLQVSLAHRLRALAATAQEKVNTLPLPEGLPQSTFAGGMIDTAAKRLILVWMGDSRIRLWGPDGLEHTDELGDTFHTQERWSSHQGLVGQMHVFAAPLEGVSRVAAYSDGLARLTTSPSNQALDGLITDAGQSSTSDDVSFLELRLGPAPDWGPLPLPAPVRAVDQPSLQGAVETQPAMSPASRPVAASVAGPSTPLWLLPMVAVAGFLCVAAAVIVWRTPLGRGLLPAPTMTATSTPTPAEPLPLVASATPALASSPTATLPLVPTATLESSPTLAPTWTATATPVPTTTPMLTWTPSPTSSPTATPTPTWTLTPTPTRTLTPTPTATSTPMPTPTPSPTLVQSPTLTPTVSSTPAPSPGAEPTATLEPSLNAPPTLDDLSSIREGPEAVSAGEGMWYTILAG